MKKLKKLTMILMSVCLFFTMSSVSSATLAAIDTSVKQKKHIKVVHVGHGEYSIVTDSENKGAKATLVEGEQVYRLKDETYLSLVNETTLIQVQKTSIHLYNQAEVAQTLASVELSEELENDILEQSRKAIAAENQDAVAILYTPAPPLQDPGTIGPMAQITSFYTYNGRNLRQDMIYYYNLSTTWVTVVSGSTAKTVAQGIYDFGMILGGTAQGVIGTAFSLFSGGISAVQAFINGTGYAPIGGVTEDRVQVKINYDVWTKYDYVQDCTGCQGATYLLGSVTQQVKIHTVKNYMYFLINNTTGKEIELTTYVNVTYSTPNFSVPALKAIQYYGTPWTERVNFKVWNQEVAF